MTDIVEPDPGTLSGPGEVVELRYEVPATEYNATDVSEYGFEGDGPVPAAEYGNLTSRHEAMVNRIAAIHGGEVHAEGSELLSPEAEAYRKSVVEEVTKLTGGRR